LITLISSSFCEGEEDDDEECNSGMAAINLNAAEGEEEGEEGTSGSCKAAEEVSTGTAT
jgi:hypothetical protein